MKFITILIICLIHLFKSNEALDLNQLISARSFIYALYGVSNYNDPCSHPTGIFTCTGSGAANVVTGISIIVNDYGDIQDSFEYFVNVTTIKIDTTFTMSNIWVNFNKLTKLKSLHIVHLYDLNIQTNVILPTTGTQFEINFENINCPIPDRFFSTGDMYSLIIGTTSTRFSLPTTLSTVNNFLGKIQIPISSVYSSLPTNMNTRLLGLTDISLTVYNDISGPANSFPTFNTPFTGLNNVAIIFSYNNPKTYEFPDSIAKIGASYLQIRGAGFKLPSSGTIDFSNYKTGSYFDFFNVGFLDQCTSIKCLTLPINTEIYIGNGNVNMSYINFTNIIKTTIDSNQLSQPLPTPSTLDFTKTLMFFLTKSKFTGTIPNYYCNFNANTYSLQSNQLSGIVPTCFSCVGGNFDGTVNLFGGSNSFSNGYTSASPPSTCPTYSIDNLPTPFKTNQDTIITISGTDFGWSTQITSAPTPTPTLSILAPNSKILITIPKGDGSIKQLIAKFGGNYQFTKTFTYGYEAPALISKYYVTTLNGNNVLTLIGTGFSYINSNIVILNGVEITTPVAVTSTIDPSKDQITLPLPTTPQLFPGTAMLIAIKVGDQTSPTVNFIYNNQISITIKDLYSIGGIVTFDGVFGVSSIVGVTLSIDSKTIAVNLITPTSITFTYPIMAIGTYNLSLNIGGLDMSTTSVNVVPAPVPIVSNTYSWNIVGSSNVLVVTGTSFGYYEPNPNSVIINSVSYVPLVATASTTNPGFDQLTFVNPLSTSSITEGSIFSVQVNVQGQYSNIVYFTLIKPISMTTKDLNTTGGLVTFDGVYGTTNISIVTLSINSIQCTINSISKTSISFNYPSISTVGDYNLDLIIGGLLFTTTVKYVASPISMITEEIYTIGGSITFIGVFSTSNTSIVSLSIGGNACTVTSITPESITFTYPMLSEGDHDISLNIGGLDMSTTQVTVIKSPEPTLLSKYSWATIGNVNVMVLTGTSFGYYEPSPNSVLINGKSNVATIATASSSLGYDQITINEDALSSLTAGDLFTIEVKVLDQTSDAVNLNLIYPISITTKQLYTLGGSITFNGVFSTSDKELAILSIDGDACTIVELTPTSISFTYPGFAIGDYDLYLEIGCIEYSSIVTYIKPPPPTLLNNYSWRTLTGGENVLVLSGSGFNYQDVNSVLINDVPFESTIARASSKAGYDEITFENDTATNSFIEDELFTVVVDVDGQKSNLVNFNFIKLISVNSVTLNTTGGDISFTGVYGTSNKSIVSLSINNIECTINSINPTTITFTYPSITNAGEYNFNLNIGGLSYSSIVKYIAPVTPAPTDTPTVTPTTPTTTSPTTTSSDDQPSNSIKLSISFILSTLTFSLFLIL